MDIETEEKSQYYLVPEDLQEVNRVLIQAREDGKEGACPKEFKAAEAEVDHLFEVYDECREEEAAAMVTSAIDKINALCPPPPPPPSPPPPPPPPPPPAPKVVERLTLHINYDTDDASIKAAEDAKIDRAIEFIKKYPESTLIIEGHTDSRGSESYNYTLSYKRALAVKDYLVKKGGIDENRIKRITGYGEWNPIAPNDTADGMARNRRTEILIISE
jgi:outer membrane protein OmpA-like peptidoglycan-associated protein